MKKMLAIMCLIVVGSYSFAQQKENCITEQETCVIVSLKIDSQAEIVFEEAKFLPADKNSIKEEHQKNNFISFSEYITLGMCGELSCCFDGFFVINKQTIKDEQIYDTEPFVIVLNLKENLITFFDKTSKTYYMYNVLPGKCDF